VAAGCALTAGVAHAAWTIWGRDTTHSLAVDRPLPAPLAVQWKFTAAIPGKGGNQSGVVTDGQTVYFGSKGVFYAVDAETGNTKWQMPPAGSPGEASAPDITAVPAVAAARVFVPASEGIVTCYNATDGKLVWESPKCRG